MIVGVFGGLFLAAGAFAAVQIWAFRQFFGMNKARLKACPDCGREGFLASAPLEGQLLIRSRLAGQPRLRQGGCGYVGRFNVPQRLTLGAKIVKTLAIGLLVLWLLIGTYCSVLPLIATTRETPRSPNWAFQRSLPKS